MPSHVSIVTYHYVRQLEGSRYPKIRGLTIEKFESQIQYLVRNYSLVKMEDVVESVKTGKELPQNACLLSFDDGYKDHYKNVLPILKKFGVQGSFYPSGKAVEEHTVLDVNKIHFLLCEVSDTAHLLKEIFSLINDFRSTYSIESEEYYRNKFSFRDRFNAGDVSIIKGLMQRELPEEIRESILHTLFHKYVSQDEASFAGELYMNPQNIEQMREQGMHIGSHGFRHIWLSTLPPDDQEKEIERSLEFLQHLQIPLADWTFCYPYGDFNKNLVSVLKNKGCAVGLTVENGIADLGVNNPLLLPRLDTVDITYTA